MHTQKKHIQQPDTYPSVEVVDSKNTPIGIMPLLEVRRQGLFHRMVLVLIYTRENKVCLRKREDSRKDNYPGRWDIAVRAPLQAGKSSMDTACMKIREQIGTCATDLRFVYTIPPAPETGHAFIDLYRLDRFTLQIPALQPTQTMFVDRDEVSGLITRCPGHVTPLLIYVWKQGFIFTNG